MPRFARHNGYYAYEPRDIPRKYVLKQDETGNWIAEAYAVEDGQTTELKMRHSYIPKKREASRLVDRWMQHGY